MDVFGVGQRDDTMRYLQIFVIAAIALIGGLLIMNGGPGEQSETPRETVTEDARAPETAVRSARDQRRIEERAARRAELEAQVETEFAYLRYAVDTSGPTPTACLSFSEALDPEVDYSTYVRFRPNFQAAFTVNGRDLCIGGLSFSSDRRAILLSGLPSADGDTLAEEEELRIDFSDRPPYVGFKGSGVILPRIDADGLPIETVNVDALTVRVVRVNDRALVFKTITEGTTRSQGGYGSLWGDESPFSVSTEVFSGKIDVETVANAPVTTVFPLADTIGDLEPGAYFVQVTDAQEGLGRNGPPAQAQRWIITTDLALTGYRGETGLDVTVRSLQTAQPVSDVRVELIAENNQVLATRTTDSDGTFRLDEPILDGEGNMRPRMLMAYGPRGDFAVLDFRRSPIDLSSEPVGGRLTAGSVDAFVYTERGIYRPGETVHLTAMIRDETGRALEDRSGTLVLYRPNGLEADRQRFDAPGSGGAVQWDYDLPRSASRGMWRMVVQMDGNEGASGEVSFSVEDFVPQRISVDLDADTETPMSVRETRDVAVETRFLYGAPGAGLEIVSEARLVADGNGFEGFDGYRFGDTDQSFSTQIINLPDVVADGAGEAVIPINVGNRGLQADRPLRVQALVSVLEPGGRAVSKQISIPYRPADAYLGVKRMADSADGVADGDRTVTFNTVSLDAAGDAQRARLDWRVVRVRYDYDWYREGSTWRWRRTRYVETLNEGVLSLEDGDVGTIVADNLDRWGDHQLIVEDRLSGNTTTYRFWMGWRGSDDGVEAPDRVRVSAPDTAPDVGERTELAILPPYDGKAQIVVATDRVLSVTHMDVKQAGTTLSLPVDEAWGEGAYVMVSVFTPRDATLNPKPRRAVGVTYVPVDTSSRTFDVSFKAPDVARPRTEQTITVNLEGGPRREEVFLTLAAVDEGILALTNFATPDPAGHYFGKRALGVELYDDYGRLIDPNMGVPAEVRSGGDSLGGEGLSVVPTQTVALWSGIVEAGRNGEAEITFDMPNFNGEVRLMAVAWSKSGVGSGDQAMIIRDPVPTEVSLPRFLAPGDTALATVSIDNVELDAGTFDASIATDTGLRVADRAISETLETGRRADMDVSVSALEEGVNTVTLNVTGPDGFDVSRDYNIQTRSPFLPATFLDRELMSPGASYAPAEGLMSAFVLGSGEVVVSFSPLPIDAGALYASLSRYPYGCTEQTVSRAMPLLYAEQLAAIAGKDGEDDADARRKVQDAIETLLSRQSPDGAIGLWREGDRDASPWVGAYTVDFLHRAREADYNVPRAALDRALDALDSVAQGEAWRVYGYETDVYESRWHNDTETHLMKRSSAYALYVLARAGRVDVSRLRYMHDQELQSIRSPLARAHLGAGLAFLGDRSRANSAFEAAVEALGYDNSGDYYQTPLRDLAAVLALAAEADMEGVLEDLSRRLATDIPEPQRLMTQEKVFLLLATNALTQGEAIPDISVEGMPEAAGLDSFVLLRGDLQRGVSFENAGGAPVWRTTLSRGAPTIAPPPASSDASVSKTIFTVTGEQTDLGSVVQGDRFVIEIEINPDMRRLNPMIVADLLPAGFEIEAVLRPADASDDGNFAWLDTLHATKVAEARDDRFVAAVDVFGEARRMAYVVRAVTPGTYTMPGTVVEDMYRPDVFARSGARTVIIRPRS